MLTFTMGGYSQTNPFDLQYRLAPEDRSMEREEVTPVETPVEVTIDESSTADATVTLPSEAEEKSPESTTIVEAVEQRHAEAAAEASTAAKEESVDSLASGDAVITTDTTSSGKNPLFLFLMLIAATLLTTLTISSNKNLVNNILRAVLNDNYLNLMYREHKKSGSIHYYILYFVFAVNAGLFLYFALMKTVMSDGMPVLWRCVSLVALIYLVRHVFLNYLSYVYPFQKEVEQYSFTILIFNIFLGLVLLPVNVFLAFSPENIAKFFLYAGLIFLAIVYIFRQLRGVFISSRLLFNNKFYFLLYLCAVEIAPIVILLKYAGAYMS